jgi:YD repeat-containing protein
MEDTKNRLIQIEWNSDGKRVEIHLNDAGIDYLASLLDHLRSEAAPNDIHLMTPSWGGNELSEGEHPGNNDVVNHLKIFKW